MRNAKLELSLSGQMYVLESMSDVCGYPCPAALVYTIVGYSSEITTSPTILFVEALGRPAVASLLECRVPCGQSP